MVPIVAEPCFAMVNQSRSDVAEYIRNFDSSLSEIFPNFTIPADWEAYTTAIVNHSIPDINTLTYDAPRHGLPNAALLQMMTMPPSTWINSSYTVFLPNSFNSTEPLNLPIFHRAPAATSTLATYTGFLFPSLGDNGELALAPGYSPASHNGEMVSMSFPPLERTRVAEVMAISSSAAGPLTSPAWVSAIFRNKGATNEELPAVLECFPFGLQGLAPALSLEVTSAASTALVWSPPYRGIDGGYSDNSAVINSISSMIADCEGGDASLACATKTLDVIAVDNDAAGPGSHTGAACLFVKDGCPPPGEFFRYEGPGFDGNPDPSLGGLLTPSIAIFSDAYPREEDWAEYVAPVLEGPSDQLYNGSRVTAGQFHTVDNQAWAVVAGYTVNLILFEINSPQVGNRVPRQCAH